MFIFKHQNNFRQAQNAGFALNILKNLRRQVPKSSRKFGLLSCPQQESRTLEGNVIVLLHFPLGK